MPPNTPSGDGSVFGGTSDPSATTGTDPFEETTEQAAPEASSQEQTDAPVPQEGQPEAAPSTESAEPVPQEGQEQTPVTFAGRPFASMEAAEQAYHNIQLLQNRTADRARQAEERAAQYEAYLSQQFQQAQQGAAPQAPAAPIPPPAGMDPAEWAQLQAQLNPILTPLVEARIAQVRQEWDGRQQQWQAQLEAQRTIAESETAVAAYRQAHPEILAHSPEEAEVADFMREYGMPLEISAMNRATEIVQNSRLASVVRANPAFAHSDDGLALAKTLASLPAAQAQALQRATAEQAQAAEANRRAAFVETGGSGAPAAAAPGQRPADEFDEALSAYRSQPGARAFGR